MVSPSLVDAVIWQESRGDPKAVSPVGAMGLMQIMPNTAKQPGFGIQPLQDPFNPEDNKRFGTEYLGAMLNRYNGDKEAALAAYNWGAGNADKWVEAGKPMDMLPQETRDYIPKVLGKEQQLEGGQDKPKLTKEQAMKIAIERGLIEKPKLTKERARQIAIERGLIKQDEAPQQSEYADMSGKDVALTAAKNLPASAYRELKGVWDAVTNPVDTSKAILELGKGVLRLGVNEEVNPDNPIAPFLESLNISRDAILSDEDKSSDAAAKAVGQYYVDQYGDMESIKKRIAEEPAAFLSDISVPLTGGAALGVKAGGTIGKVAKGVGKVAENLDVTNLAAKTAIAPISGMQLDKAAELLKNEGINLTIGQRAGGFVRSTEEKIKGTVPLVGDVIRSKYEKGIREFNQAAMNRALNPIGTSTKNLKIDTVNPEALGQISDTLTDAYEKVLPNLKLKVTTDLVDELDGKVKSATSLMADETGNQLNKIYRQIVETPLYSNDVLDGKTLKSIQSDLGRIKGNYSKSSASGDVAILDAIDDIQSTLRERLTQNNPKYAKRLKEIDTGYANYVILRRAMASAGDKAEGFTPAQLKSAIRAEDKSVGKGNVARGRALMQDLADAGVQYLPAKIPDSGTAGRLITIATAGGLIAIEPLTAAFIALGTAPFVSRRLAGAVLEGRPAAIKKATAILKKAPKLTGQTLSEVAQTKETVDNSAQKDAE